ncbi:MAG: aminopeptidase, partial [Phycisphaerales bacterium]
MNDPRHDKLADVLVRYSTRVKKGDLVGIRADPVAMPLVLAVQRACLRAGANCVFLCQPEEWNETLVEVGSDEQIGWASSMTGWYIENVDVSIAFWAEVNPKHMTRYEARKAALLQQARRPYLKTFMQREADGKLRWCGTQFPTHGAAQDAEMSLRQYEDFVFRAGLLHLPDPVAAWQKVFDSQERVREYLQGKKALRFQVPAYGGNDGTDLTVDCSKSIWINCGGHENFPDGEVFAGPGAVDGHVNYTFPAVYQGREVQGVRLKFKGGRVVEASAKKGEDFLFKMLDQDPGARNLGEIAIGTNYGITEFSRNTLFDEKIGGTFHAAVGAGYPKSGNSNESGLHWDMVC